MYSVVEPLLRTAARFNANTSTGFSENGSDCGSHFSVKDHEDKETSLDRLFSNVGNHVYKNGVVKPAVNGTTQVAVETATTTATTTSVLSSLPKRTMVHPARRVLEEREYGGGVFRSVSFDERAEWNYDQRSSSSSLDKVNEHEGNIGRNERTGGEEGGNKESVSMDKISTMTLTEFKSLLSSSLSVQDNLQSAPQNGLMCGSSSARSSAGSGDFSQQQPNWDSLREKARSVRDSISTSVNNRRAAGAGSTPRRSLPQSPDDPAPPSYFERPKTPQALKRNRNPSSGRTSPVSRPKTPTSISRPKTPTSSISRPKTPTSGIARPKTPSSAPREEYRMSRPKTPSQVKRDAVAKVAGAISNWVDSRPEVANPDRPPSAASRPKTPTSRPKTPTRQQVSRQWTSGEDGDADIDDDLDDDEDNAELSNFETSRAVPAAARDRPATPSRIPKPCFTPRPTTPKISSIPVPIDTSSTIVSRERSHTVPATSSSTLTSQEQEIILRQQQLLRLQEELEEAQIRADEERRKLEQNQRRQEQENQISQLRQQSHASRPNFLPTNSLTRSDSNASSGMSPSEFAQSPASINGDKNFPPKNKIAVSRKLPLPRGSSEDSGSVSRSYREIHSTRRCVTPGPGSGESRTQPSRAVTPGPREKWTIGKQPGCSAGVGKAPQHRRGSLNTGFVAARENSSCRGVSNISDTSNNVHNTNCISQNLSNGISFTNEITFSDDEEINELVRNTALMNATPGATQSADSSRVRSASVDARQLERQSARRNSKGGEEVLMIRRDSSGGHAIDMLSNNSNNRVSAGRDKPVASNIIRRPQTNSSIKSTTTAASSAATNRFRSQTPDPSMFRQKLVPSGGKAAPGARPTTPSADSHARGGSNTKKSLNRTEAWVDSTLSDPKRKLPTKPRRTKTGMAGEIMASELAPRPLEEIQALLSTPRDGVGGSAVDATALDAPPEDPEMFRKMEKLFEKYREMELRASVNETPGVPAAQGPAAGKSSSDAQSSGRPGSLKSSGGGASSSGKPPVSVRTSSSGSQASNSGSIGVRASTSRQNSANSADSENARYRRASSVPHQYRRSASTTTSALNSPSVELKEFSEGSGFCTNASSINERPRAISHGEAEQKRLENSLMDIDPETAKNPTALITKIKEILKVRPRRDENTKIARTRIPAPSSLSRANRSKSVSNLYNGGVDEQRASPGQGMSSSGRGVLKHTSSSNTRSQLSKANSGSSGNIAYSEFVFNDEDEKTDNVPELSRAWSVKSDSSDSQTRSETPIPKLATPLTTGRSTLISRMGRSFSQDKENNLSNSQTSLSGKSTFSTTEEDADYV
ncbi:Gas2-like protein 2 [Plakobranchus ocellatus]|uniref:Gas2-like protein 2 n=1 Tax=Plakobranchus ocellatus TaxID=259542 RepID=A0AAV3YRH0_9GAST|nr:Gas2-like protein 2 [Plakobranchus ocellatus]